MSTADEVGYRWCAKCQIPHGRREFCPAQWPEHEIPSAGNQVTSTPAPTETRIVDPQTGGEKGMKLARFSLIPADWLWALAEHFGVGAKKYDDRNWERGYKWSLSIDAHGRHMAQWLSGEDNDAETGSSHLIAAAWHLLVLWWFQKHGKGTNDVRNG